MIPIQALRTWQLLAALMLIASWSLLEIETARAADDLRSGTWQLVKRQLPD